MENQAAHKDDPKAAHEVEVCPFDLSPGDVITFDYPDNGGKLRGRIYEVVEAPTEACPKMTGTSRANGTTKPFCSI